MSDPQEQQEMMRQYVERCGKDFFGVTVEVGQEVIHRYGTHLRLSKIVRIDSQTMVKGIYVKGLKAPVNNMDIIVMNKEMIALAKYNRKNNV